MTVQQPSHPGPLVNHTDELPGDAPEQLRAVVRMLRTYEAGDFDTLWTLFSPDCDFAVLDRFGIAKTWPNYQTFMRTFLAAFPDVHHAIPDYTVDGDKVWLLYNVTGTHQGPLRGMAPTGRSVDYSIVSMYRITDGLISKTDFISDDLRMRTQLGYLHPTSPQPQPAPAAQRVMPAELPSHIADNNAYSYGVLTGNELHISGMVAFAPDGSYVGLNDIDAQAECVFNNLQAVLQAAGGSLDDVVSTTTYLASRDHAAAVGAVRRSYFTSDVPPTSTVVIAPMAREQFLLEVSAIAHLHPASNS